MTKHWVSIFIILSELKVLSSFSNKAVGVFDDIWLDPCQTAACTFVQSALEEKAHPEYVVPKSIAATNNLLQVDGVGSAFAITGKQENINSNIHISIVHFNLKEKKNILSYWFQNIWLLSKMYLPLKTGHYSSGH